MSGPRRDGDGFFSGECDQEGCSAYFEIPMIHWHLPEGWREFVVNRKRELRCPEHLIGADSEVSP